MTKAISLKTTDLVKNICEPGEAPEKYLIFGKVFEEVYTEFTWLRSKSPNITKKKFLSKLAAKLKEEGVTDKELIRKGYKIYSCFLKEDVVGRKPKSRWKDIKIAAKEEEYSVRIYAQPDLKDLDTFYEFKTGPITEYGELQAQIFYWVFEEPIILVGVEENDEGYINAEKQTIDYCDVNIRETVKEMIKTKKVG